MDRIIISVRLSKNFIDILSKTQEKLNFLFLSDVVRLAIRTLYHVLHDDDETLQRYIKELRKHIEQVNQ